MLKDENIRILNAELHKESADIGRSSVVNLDFAKIDSLNKMIKDDAKFLSRMGLMDYSLYLAVESSASNQRNQFTINSLNSEERK